MGGARYHICKLCGKSILETGESQIKHLLKRHRIKTTYKIASRQHFRAPFGEDNIVNR